MRDWRVTRFLIVGVALVILSTASCVGGSETDGQNGTSPASSDPSSPPVGATDEPNPKGIFKLDHLIFVVMENRSFDHYFGTFPKADGLPTDASGPTTCIPNPYGDTCARPYHTDSLFQDAGPHDHPAAVTDVNGGRMDGFIRALGPGRSHCYTTPTLPGCDQRLGPDGQSDVMSYHDEREIPNYWTYARRFVLQDRMFGPTDSWTLPAHLFLVSAWSARCADPADPMSCESDLELQNPRYVHRYGEEPVYAWTPITWLLEEQGVPWAYYVDDGTCFDPPCVDEPGGTASGKNPLPGFTAIEETGQIDSIRHHEEYFAAAEAGELPSVSWVVPGKGYSEHPGDPEPISNGMAFVTRLVNAAMKGPDWDRTAIFVTWDDWGGFYDHVEPPRVDENGYGLRVPGLLISPYAERGMIDSQTLTFDAYLKLIEDRFLDGQRLDPETDGRPDSRPTVREDVKILGDLRKEFDFHQDPRPPLILDPTPNG